MFHKDASPLRWANIKMFCSIIEKLKNICPSKKFRIFEIYIKQSQNSSVIKRGPHLKIKNIQADE